MDARVPARSRAAIVLPSQAAGSEYADLWNNPVPSGPVRVLRREVRSRYLRETAFGPLEIYRLSQGP